ncbi:Uncharacterised protein [Mycobacteroides abscessus subsp. abscessus]|nr:Uncharacterised protein [Mycobacteroides abscessus subsp. abscessus]
MGKCEAVDHVGNIAKLRVDRLHIFQPGRCIIKQIGNGDICPFPARGLFKFCNLSAFNQDPCACISCRGHFHL